MFHRVVDLAIVAVAASLLTAVLAKPVLESPGQRVFGQEIVGRHHDPFTAMAQFERPIHFDLYSQPVTDGAGRLFARVSGGVQAYNWLVLLSFPLAAMTAYLLARFIALSRSASFAAAFAYAFSPFHLAHAAYHPHVAQTQWMPLYLLALFACLQHPLLIRVASLALAAMLLTLADFYAGFIAAVITPFIVAIYFVAHPGSPSRSLRDMMLTAVPLVGATAMCVTYAYGVAPELVLNRSAFAAQQADLARYGARWWSYLVPPVAHPMMGDWTRHLWAVNGVHEGMLEQQIYVGLGVLVLAFIAAWTWWTLRDRTASTQAAAWTPVLAAIGILAFACSLAPASIPGAPAAPVPSASLWYVAPMFRSYARFGSLVQLMAVLLAGLGIDALRRTRVSIGGPALCVALLMLTGVEYFVWPSQLWRDTLPTTAHRWAAQQAETQRVLDCTRLDAQTQSIVWLTNGRISMNGPTVDCTEPNLALKSAAAGYTQLLVPTTTTDGQWFLRNASRAGLRAVARFDDAEVFDVIAAKPALYTAAMAGFSVREHDTAHAWQWMGAGAFWTFVNTGEVTVNGTLSLELTAFDTVRRLTIRLDGREIQSIIVEPTRHPYAIGPFVITSGIHLLTFTPATPPTVVSSVMVSQDDRALSFMFGPWSWTAWPLSPDVAGP